MKIEQLFLKKILDNKSLFLYGNNATFISSFINVIKKFLSNKFKFTEIEDVTNFTTNIQYDLFQDKTPCFIIPKAEDKIISNINSLLTKHLLIIVQGNFLKSKTLAAELKKKANIISIPFFTNSLTGYIEFLLKNLGYDTKCVNNIVEEYLATSEDPVMIIDKLAAVNFKYSSEQKTRSSIQNLEPIPMLRLLSSYVKNSYGNMSFLLNRNTYSDKELIEKFLSLEIKYKTENLKSKIFIQKEFL